MQARSRATVEKIQAATEALIERTGFGRLTIDGVAAEAGVSKGGVLHHFPNKEALVASLATRKLLSLREGSRAASAKLGDATAPALRGMIDHAASTYECDDGFSRALLVAAVESSTCLAEFQTLFTDTLGEVRAESRDPDLGTALLFAVIGMQVARTLGFAQLTAERADAAFASLNHAAETNGRRGSAPAPKNPSSSDA